MSLKRYNKKNILIYVLVFSIFLTPNIKILNFPAVRVEQIIVLSLILYSLITFYKAKKISFKYTLISKALLLFPVVIIVSICVGFFVGFTPIINDFFEIYKVIVYLSVTLVVANSINRNSERVFVLNAVVQLGSISVLLAITQYFNFLDLNKYYIPYIAPTQYETLINGYGNPRVVGFAANPNVFAALLAISFLVSTFLLVRKKKIKYFLYTIINFVGVLLTSSRSGFVFMLVSFLIFVFLKLEIIMSIKLFFLKKNRSFLQLKSLYILLFIFIAFISFLLILPERFTWRLIEGLNLSESTSWQARLVKWNDLINYFKASPLVGIGPSKYHMTAHFDNEWLLLLSRYGIFGVIFFLSIFIAPLIKNEIVEDYRALYISVLIGLGLYMIPSIAYHSFQLMSLVFLLLATLDTRKTFQQK